MTDIRRLRCIQTYKNSIMLGTSSTSSSSPSLYRDYWSFQSLYISRDWQPKNNLYTTLLFIPVRLFWAFDRPLLTFLHLYGTTNLFILCLYHVTDNLWIQAIFIACMTINSSRQLIDLPHSHSLSLTNMDWATFFIFFHHVTDSQQITSIPTYLHYRLSDPFDPVHYLVFHRLPI